MNRYYRMACWGLIICGVSLRVLLCWVNPPVNAFDNHFDPIFWIMKYGTIAPKDALWQSYHPPVFYFLSAMVGKMALYFGVPVSLIPKILQFIPCLYASLTLVIIYLILEKMPLSLFSRWCALGIICFLPRHIYAAAMHSNDMIAVLGVTLSLYLLLLAREHEFIYTWVGVAGVVIVGTIFTKYTAFVVLPLAFVTYASAFFQKPSLSYKKLCLAGIFLVVIPLSSLGSYCYVNQKTYGSPLPWNVAMLDPAKTQVKSDNGINFFDFRPWTTISTPLLTPSNINSFWTLIHGRMWFDLEPKFVYFTDHDKSGWKRYYQWLRGEASWSTQQFLNRKCRVIGSSLIAIGLVPLLMAVAGVILLLKKSMTCKEGPNYLLLFPLLFAANAAGIVALSLRAPVFSAIKAQYFLNSLSAFAVFIGFGAGYCERYIYLKLLIIGVFLSLFALVIAHILQVAVSLSFVMG